MALALEHSQGTEEHTRSAAITNERWDTATVGPPANRCQLEIGQFDMRDSHVAVEDELLIGMVPGHEGRLINCDDDIERA